MTLDRLPTELVLSVYRNCDSISDVINLSLTCHRLHSLLPQSQKIAVLFAAAEREMGPIQDIVQLLTLNASQPVHLMRDPPLSMALLRQTIAIGRKALRWEAIWPQVRWDMDYIQRRELMTYERYRLRRAIYRYWLFCQAFHIPAFPRTMRLNPAVVFARCQLLRIWSTEELIEIEDFRLVMESILASHICPSDGTVYWRQADFNIRREPFGRDKIGMAHSRGIVREMFHNSYDEDGPKHELPAAQIRGMHMDGWGDEISQYHVIQSMLKLNPAQLIWLYEHVVNKSDVEDYIATLGEDWFWDNGETFLQTWILILSSRGIDVQEVREGILHGKSGIAVNIGKIVL